MRLVWPAKPNCQRSWPDYIIGTPCVTLPPTTYIGTLGTNQIHSFTMLTVNTLGGVVHECTRLRIPAVHDASHASVKGDITLPVIGHCTKARA